MTYKIGLIGFGWVAQHHLAGYSHLDEVEVAAIADVDEKRLRMARDLWGIEQLFVDYRELLEQKEIQVIDIAAPTPLHSQLSIDSCRAGKHVICEKPLCMSFEEASEILRSVEESGIKFMVNQNMRWLPKYEAVKWLLDQGIIGDPRFLHLDMFHWDYPESGWMADMERYLILQVAVHWIDLFHWWLDGHPMRAFAVTNSSRGQLRMRGENLCAITLDYGDNCYGQINCCGYSRSDAAYERSIFRIEGTKGTIEHDDNKLRYKIDATESWVEPDIPRPPCDDYEWTFAVSMRRLIEAIEEDKPPVTNIEDNMGVLKSVFACYESAKKRKMTKIT